MANTTTSPNMGMPIPVVGVDPGPDWATNIDSCFLIADGHTHLPGSGVQLTPNSLNINSDLTMNNNNLTNARSTRFFPQTANLSDPADLGCLYEVGADLWYNDGSGNQIRFTQGGSIVGTAGSITGLPSGTASASFAGGTFVWQSATNTPANMDFGSAIYRNNVANSKGLTLSPPNAMGADYSLFLPSLPGVTSIMSLDSAGNMAGAYTVDNTTIVISANVIQIPSGVNLPGVAQSQGLNLITVETNNGSGKTLSMLRANINSTTGTGLNGEGVTITKIGVGIINIAFDNPFADVPAVTGSNISNSNVYVQFSVVDANHCRAVLLQVPSNTLTDCDFSFMAIGLRN